MTVSLSIYIFIHCCRNSLLNFFFFDSFSLLLFSSLPIPSFTTPDKWDPPALRIYRRKKTRKKKVQKIFIFIRINFYSVFLFFFASNLFYSCRIYIYTKALNYINKYGISKKYRKKIKHSGEDDYSTRNNFLFGWNQFFSSHSSPLSLCVFGFKVILI